MSEAPVILEAYIGEYASGKSEVAINRALRLCEQGREVTLVDLDTVEPFYTLRPLKKQLENKGLKVIAWETKETVGLGETGSVLKPEMRWALKRPGDVILDVGYGVEGAKTLNLLEGVFKRFPLKVYVVINTARPFTSEVSDIVEYIKTLGKVDGLVNNSHLGAETDLDLVQEGARIVSKAAKILGLPVVATTAEIQIAERIGTKDCMGHPVWVIRRYMEHSFW